MYTMIVSLLTVVSLNANPAIDDASDFRYWVHGVEGVGGRPVIIFNISVKERPRFVNYISQSAGPGSTAYLMDDNPEKSIYRKLADSIYVLAISNEGEAGFILVDKNLNKLSDQVFVGFYGDIHEEVITAATAKGLGLYNISNRWIIEPGQYFLGRVSEGRVFVLDTKQDRWSFFNCAGEQVTDWVSPYLNYTVPSFSSGVCVYTSRAGIRAVDRNFAELFSLKDAINVSNFNDQGIARAETRNHLAPNSRVTAPSLMGYIALDGEWVIEPKFASAGFFIEDLAPVSYGSGWSVTSVGQWSYSPVHEDVKKVDQMWGFIDRKGDIVVQFKYDQVQHFSEGLAAVRTGDLWGYIDKHGNEVIKPQFEDADRFQRGYAVVRPANSKDSRKHVLIDTQGNYIIEFELPNY